MRFQSKLEKAGVGDAGVSRQRWLIVPLGMVLAWLEIQATANADQAVLAFDVAAGLAFLVGAVVMLGRGRGKRVGILSAVAGTAWFVGAISPLAAGAYLGPLGHLIMAYPTGRVARGVAQAVVAGVYAAGLALPFLTVDLRGPVLAAAATVAFVGAVRTRGALGRGRWSGALTGIVIAFSAGLTSVAFGQGWIGLELGQIGYAAVMAVAAIWLAVDLRWGGWSQDALTTLVVDLGDRTEPATLRGRLADALDDPTLVVGYRVAEGMGYVDEAGRPVAAPVAGSGRVAVPLTAGGTEVGVLVRDERSETDPLLAAGVAQAAELALANARLNAATRQQLDELDASRIRLIAAAEAERSRIHVELGSGALRRLALVEDRLVSGRDEEPAERLLAEVRAVIAQLDEFARGLGAGPSLEGGLDQALVQLAERSPVPVTVEVPSGRWPSIVEATAYFVASEALANIARHANATRAWLRVTEADGRLWLEVVDDGVGGAAPSSGSGLEGLTQRVEATGGRLRIEDRDGGGTRLAAELPIDLATDPAMLSPSPRA